MVNPATAGRVIAGQCRREDTEIAVEEIDAATLEIRDVVADHRVDDNEPFDVGVVDVDQDATAAVRVGVSGDSPANGHRREHHLPEADMEHAIDPVGVDDDVGGAHAGDVEVPVDVEVSGQRVVLLCACNGQGVGAGHVQKNLIPIRPLKRVGLHDRRA